jgi:hypothetical protein
MPGRFLTPFEFAQKLDVFGGICLFCFFKISMVFDGVVFSLAIIANGIEKRTSIIG